MIFMNIFYIHNHKIETPQKKYMICSLDVLILGLWINLLLPVLANGEGDIAKHMFLFTNCIDILFFVCIIGIISMPLKKLIRAAAALAVLTGIFYIHMPRESVTFGRLNGRDIEWTVEKTDGNTMLLITKDCIGYMPFDDKTNDWETSDLRRWLNDDFLDEFSDEEKSRIIETENTVPLIYDERGRAQTGNHAHYWNLTKALANDMLDTAYRHQVKDRVFIPSLDMIEDISGGGTYWILCPYTSNNFMQRFMNYDGFLLHTDIASEKGVRAVIRIKTK